MLAVYRNEHFMSNFVNRHEESCEKMTIHTFSQVLELLGNIKKHTNDIKVKKEIGDIIEFVQDRATLYSCSVH